jgi:hypothetical protein
MTDVCSSTSELDCGQCTSDKLVRILGRTRCVATCSGTGVRCKRLSLHTDDLDKCLQHSVMNVDTLSPAERKTLRLFVYNSDLTDARKREYTLMIAGRLLPTVIVDQVKSFFVPRDGQLRKAIEDSDFGYNTLESIELLRRVYALDKDIPLLIDTMRTNDIHRLDLDPNLQYHIWHTSDRRTNRLIDVAKLTNIVILSTRQGDTRGRTDIRGDRGPTGLVNSYTCDTLLRVHYILPFVTHIGNNWTSSCYYLTHVTFDLANLREVGISWLSNLHSLTSINFKGLPRLEHVGADWMQSSQRLYQVEFAGLHNLVSVGKNWLMDTAVVSPRFGDLKKLELVDPGWMACCIHLVAPDFRGLDMLTTVGERSMVGCGRGLETPDLSVIPNLADLDPSN